MSYPNDYEVGQVLRYREENADYMIKVLESNGTLEKEIYLLKILKINEQHWLAPYKIGEKFIASRLRDAFIPIGWRLEELVEKEQ